MVALLVAASTAAAASPVKSRTFDAAPESVWAAALAVARDMFAVDRAIQEEARLLFRSGPFRGYRFEVTVVPAGPGKARVFIELKSSRPFLEKAAQRDAERYLVLLAQRLQGLPK